MNERTIAGLIVLGMLLGSSAAVSRADIMDVYKNIDDMSRKNTPDAYTVTVENKKFAEALQELPKDILTGKGKPYVTVRFRKGEGVRIVIENVKSEYVSLFSMYEDYLRFSGISKVQNPIELKETIDKKKVELSSEDQDNVVLKAWDPTKEQRDNNYALFYLDKKNWVIRKAVYYLEGNPYLESENNYKAFGAYYLPYKITLNYKNENASEVFLFKDYKIKE